MGTVNLGGRARLEGSADCSGALEGWAGGNGEGTVALSKPGAGWIPFLWCDQIAMVSSVKAVATRSVVGFSTPSS
jgi:hypothetical protein